MLGSLLLSSPADADPDGPRELLAPDTPVLAGRVGCKRTRAGHRGKRTWDAEEEAEQGMEQRRQKTPRRRKHNETTDAEGQTVRVQRHRTKDSREKEGRMGDRRL